ncbi:MAG: hypothetical protein KBD78_08620 [Oligoflexales bacterium]|nr:hypothetical protein [Oligoflexales bacterium]
MIGKKNLIIIFISSYFFSGLALANYVQAQGFLAKKQYDLAAPAFFQAYAYPKNKQERLKAEWGLAKSLQEMGLFYSASKFYSVIVRRGAGDGNAFFRQALEELGKINSQLNLGQSHVLQLFKAKIDPAAVPGPARGFYFHYLGIESFREGKYETAERHFTKVPQSSEYYVKAMFHRGVIANLSGRRSRALDIFKQVKSVAGRSEGSTGMVDLANLNIARVHYEAKRYRDAISFYAQIPRFTEYWLQAIFESAWAFFLMQKHNNALGNLHTIQSPFFDNRFYPESYILQAVTYLRLCRYDEVKGSMRGFKDNYSPYMNEIKSVLAEYRGNPNRFFKLIYDYDVGVLRRHQRIWSVFDSISRIDAFKEAGETIRFSDRELARLGRATGPWTSSGLKDELRDFLSQKKSLAVANAGKQLYSQARDSYEYLLELSRQTELINAEMLLGKVDKLREKLQVGTAEKKAVFIGGMQSLQIGQELEYWPFKQEYWKDELGGYVYNIDSQCSKAAN